MSGFRRKIEIIRRSGGAVNDDGMYVPPQEVSISIKASVQPLNQTERGLYTQALPEGRRTANYIKLYTANPLISTKGVVGDYGDTMSDIVLWQGRQWEVVHVDAFQSNVISHYKAVAVEVMDQ